MLTLEEAIKHCIEVAEENERDIGYYTIQGDKEWLDECEKDCIECAKEHRQLAKWLTELKTYRKLIANADKLIESEYGVVIIEGYKDVLAQMKEVYEEVKADEDSD